jgi:hypothetical protein
MQGRRLFRDGRRELMNGRHVPNHTPNFYFVKYFVSQSDEAK